MIARGAIVAVLAMATAACSHETNKDYAAMNKIPMHTVCVGRMLVNLPEGGRMDWQQHFDYAQVSRLASSVNDTDAFWVMVEKKKSALASEKHNTEPSLLSGYLKVGDDAAMLLHRESASDVYGYDLDRYLWLGHWGYWFESKALLDNSQKNQFSTFDKALKRLVPINNFHLPQEPGFCIDGALVTGKIGPIWSGVSSSIKGWKNTSVNAGASEDDGARAQFSWEKVGRPLPIPTPFDDLEMFKSWADESKQSGDDDRAVSFEVLRKENRQLAGMRGEEIAVKATLANGQEWYRFEWNSPNDTTRSQKPGFAFGLEAGNKDYTPKYVPPPSQDDLLALWDAMLDSLKPRPGAR
jgi:hypothetical protein